MLLLVLPSFKVNNVLSLEKIIRSFEKGLLQKESGLMGDNLTKLDLSIVSLVIYLYCMDRHFFLEEILRSVNIISIWWLNTYVKKQVELCCIYRNFKFGLWDLYLELKTGSLHCDTWSTCRSSTLGVLGWSANKALHASL